MRLYFFLKNSVFFSVFLTLLSSAEVRTWTNINGRTMEAELIRANLDFVFFKMGGREVKFPFRRMSLKDQEYLKEWMSNPSSREEMEEDDVQEPTKSESNETAQLTAEVPTRTGPPAAFNAVVVSEDAEKDKYSYSSPHFLFISDRRLTSRVVRGFSKLYEATYEAVRAMPWGTKLDPKTPDGLFPVYLFSQEEDFLKAGGIPGSAGTAHGSKSLVQMRYLGVKDTGSRLILEEIEDNDIIVHELTHALRDHADRGLPVWAVEGFAEYIASAPYNRTGKFTLKDRPEEIAAYVRNRGARGGAFQFEHSFKELLGVDRKTFFKSSEGGLGEGASMSYTSAVLVMGYLWHGDQGKDDKQRIGGPVRSWLAAMKDGKKETEARPLLFDGRTNEEMEKAIISFYRRELDISFPN